MSDGPLSPEGLPKWMILFSFISSLILTLLALVEGFCRALKKAACEITLTREVFFRILDSGESLYANVVLVAYDNGALIHTIKAILAKNGGATKQFSLRVAQIGEKFRLPDGTYNFSFHSTSPLAFVPPNSPQRLVFVCEHDNYADHTSQAFQQFQRKLLEFKERYVNADKTDNALLAQLGSEFDLFIEAFTVQIMDRVQIEPGNYTLSIIVTYRQMGKFLPFAGLRTADAKVDFTVEDYARDLFRSSLRDNLVARGRQVIFATTNPIPAPQYIPTAIREFPK